MNRINSLQYSKANQAWLFISGNAVLKVSPTLEGIVDRLKTETKLTDDEILRLTNEALGVK